jgi:hypothetical protein
MTECFYCGRKVPVNENRLIPHKNPWFKGLILGKKCNGSNLEESINAKCIESRAKAKNERLY